MIPILKERVYENNVISFKTVGFLSDAHDCQVTEERNGIFEMSFSYPVESMMFSYLREDLLVLAKPNDTDNNQMFRIYEITKPINGVVTVNCEHISYELRNYPVKGVTINNSTPHVAIGILIDNAKANVSGQDSNINLYHALSSERTGTGSLKIPIGSVRSALGGIDGSVLDVFGGEFKFDNFDIYLPTSRGSDNGVIVAYRKNLTDVKLTTSMESSYTGLFPYAVKDDEYTFLSSTQYPTGSISVTNNSGIAERILMRDFTSEFGDNEEITPAALLAKSQTFLNNNDINALTASMSVSFVNLWQSEEYKDYAPLEKVSLCDIVTVYHEKLGINLKLKVIKTVYDPISERYIKIELGSPKSDFAATIAQQQKQVNEAVKIARSTGYSQITAEYQQAIADATAKITGNSGGNVRFTLNAVGKPEEITVMDTGDTSTATRCWRWNLSGFGYSSTGYSGTYETAITADGEINANFITTGTMTAERVRTGILASADSNTFFDLTSGLIQTFDGDENNSRGVLSGGGFGMFKGSSSAKIGLLATSYFSSDNWSWESKSKSYGPILGYYDDYTSSTTFSCVRIGQISSGGVTPVATFRQGYGLKIENSGYNTTAQHARQPHRGTFIFNKNHDTTGNIYIGSSGSSVFYQISVNNSAATSSNTSVATVGRVSNTLINIVGQGKGTAVITVTLSSGGKEYYQVNVDSSKKFVIYKQGTVDVPSTVIANGWGSFSNIRGVEISATENENNYGVIGGYQCNYSYGSAVRSPIEIYFNSDGIDFVGSGTVKFNGKEILVAT